jgi:hypothetical protein
MKKYRFYINAQRDEQTNKYATNNAIDVHLH